VDDRHRLVVRRRPGERSGRARFLVGGWRSVATFVHAPAVILVPQFRTTRIISRGTWADGRRPRAGHILGVEASSARGCGTRTTRSRTAQGTLTKGGVPAGSSKSSRGRGCFDVEPIITERGGFAQTHGQGSPSGVGDPVAVSRADCKDTNQVDDRIGRRCGADGPFADDLLAFWPERRGAETVVIEARDPGSFRLGAPAGGIGYEQRRSDFYSY